MKILIIIFGLLCGDQCLGQLGIGFRDYDDYNAYPDYIDSVNHDPVSVVSIVSKGETFVKNLTETVLLPCNINGSNDYVRLWRKGVYILYQSHVRIGASENFEELPNGTLKITNLTPQDAGQYVCLALVFKNAEKNPRIIHTLKIQVPPKIISLTAEDNRTNLVSGNTLSLHCLATGYPAPVISWHKDGEKLSAEGENLIISNAKHYNAGEYTCQADNQIGKPDVQSISIEVNFHDNYDDPEDEDNLPANEQVISAISEGEQLERNLGESVLLPCIFSGGDDYIRRWKKGEIILYQSTVRMGASNNTQEMKNGTLYITNLTGNDDGQYVCSALISADNAKNPTIVHTLRVIRSPQIEDKQGRNSSGCSSLTSAATLINIASVVIFLVRPW